jgi:hypothetical protein
MPKAKGTALTRHRRRLKREGIVRVEIQVRKEDADLLRDVARALGAPEEAEGTRALLRAHFGARRVQGLKALLAAAPLEGLDLERSRDPGRVVDL